MNLVNKHQTFKFWVFQIERLEPSMMLFDLQTFKITLLLLFHLTFNSFLVVTNIYIDE